VLLQKTLLNIEGLGRDLYPQLDLWQTARPLLKSWYRERTRPRRLLGEARQHLPELVQMLRATPPLVRRLVHEAEDSRRLLGASPAAEEARAEQLRAIARRHDETIVAVAVLGLGVFWLALADPWWAGALATAAATGYLLARR